MQTEKKPFFARFLEGQKSAKENEDPKAQRMTTKFPSDNDEWWP